MTTTSSVPSATETSLLSQLDDYELVYDNQDVRGWDVLDAAGSRVGSVRDFLVDLRRDRVAAIVLDTGKQHPVEHISIGDHVVLLDGGVERTARRAAHGPASTPSPLATTAAGLVGAEAATTTSATQPLTTPGSAVVIPVIEEEMRVSKRMVDRGGVRLTAQVVERPVDETVTLREEHVHVERHPVDQPVPAGAADFQGRSVALVEHAEEAVVARQARVVEEVIVGKTVEQRTENVHGTVRRTEVQVEHLDAFDPNRYEDHYRQHLATSGLSFQQVAPAYGFGHMLRRDRHFAGKDWSRLEADARHTWEARQPGTWERIKGAVHHAWMDATP